MFGAQQQQPGFPTVPSQDPEALLAYAEATAAYARCLQRMAPQSQHHTQQRQLPGHESYNASQSGSRQADDAEVTRSTKATEPRSPSLWTIIACLAIGAVGGVACDRNMRAAADDGRPQPQQQHDQKFFR